MFGRTNIRPVKNGLCMDKIHISSEVLTAHEVQQLEALLKSCPDNFSCSDTDVGHSTRVRHQINVTNEIPFKERHRYIKACTVGSENTYSSCWTVE